MCLAAQEWSERIWDWKKAYGLSKLWEIAPAGADRQQSIRNGLLAAKQFMREETAGVIVQDAARPLTSQDLLRRLTEGLEEAAAVMPVLPVTDTTYTSQDGQWVDGLLDRRTLFAGQAPEAFRSRPTAPAQYSSESQLPNVLQNLPVGPPAAKQQRCAQHKSAHTLRRVFQNLIRTARPVPVDFKVHVLFDRQ